MVSMEKHAFIDFFAKTWSMLYDTFISSTFRGSCLLDAGALNVHSAHWLLVHLPMAETQNLQVAALHWLLVRLQS